MNTPSVKQTINDLNFYREAVINSTNDDGFQALLGLRDFLSNNSLTRDFIQKSSDRTYSDEELYEGRKFSRYIIPSNKEGRIGFIWSLINNWVDTKKSYDYFKIAYLYGGGSNRIDDYIEEFHQIVIEPFVKLIENYLEELIEQNTTEGKIIVNNHNGNVALQYQSPGSTINFNTDITQTISEIIKEITNSHYTEKEQLLSLLKLLVENKNGISQDKGFLLLLAEKWNPYLILIQASEYALKFSDFLNLLLAKITQ